MKMEKTHNQLYEPLAAIVGSKYVTDEDFALYAYSRDSGIFPASIPGIVVRPATTEEVSEIIKLANETRTPVIPRGGAATLYGVPRGIPKKV